MSIDTSSTITGSISTDHLAEYASANTPKPRPVPGRFNIQLPGEFQVQYPTHFGEKVVDIITIDVKGAKVSGGVFDGAAVQDFRLTSEVKQDKLNGNKPFDDITDFLKSFGVDRQALGGDVAAITAAVHEKAGAIAENVRMTYVGRTKDANNKTVRIYYKKTGGFGKLPVNPDGSVRRVVFKGDSEGHYISEKPGATDTEKVWVDFVPERRGFAKG